MSKYICALLLLITLLIVPTPSSATEWYEGGTLHEATIAQWKRASRQNKIATCADWVSALCMKSKLSIPISGSDDLKTCTTALVDYIDNASKNTKAIDRETVSAVALLGMIMAGWIRQGDNSDLLPIIIASKPSSPLKSAENADQKLQANGFLLADEIYAVWETEKTPNVLDKLSQEQRKAIADELSNAKKESEESSLVFGSSITDSLEKNLYQEGVCQNKVLKATRVIAQKYGIQTGDVFTVDDSVSPPELFYEGDNFYEGSDVRALVAYSPAVNRKRGFVMEHITVGTKWEPSAMVKRFGSYEQYNPADMNPRISQMFYFKDIDMSFLVNLLSFKIVTWRTGRADR